ncbi:SUMF1/EgtB/PvdO family nonheme iron enzyme [Ferdinandcohnia sp. SAFN-114]|uniref:SUMF1/EgtB/PvdO family nonheme iron enzyme n=1 Tax=Ferdinandcohnia sp. SAFN-114 TaxID=3387275 RepID=UPI003F7D47BE
MFVPGGFFTYGLDPNSVPDNRFGWHDSIPKKQVWLPPFFIDRFPVTNQDYDEFVSSIENEGHIFCHPYEPRNKDHTRNTFWDERFKSSHPVTGIDWYDAYAFSRWKGKELPTEFQWEKAARGEDGRVWPWGDTFNEKYANFSRSWSQNDIQTLQDWRNEILKFDDTYPSITTVDAESIPENTSPYGVIGMVGNNWEWTRSDYVTRRNFHPMLKNATKNNAHEFAVLKGGSFFSDIGLMYPSFRGKDIPFCRHNEMGIRCVVNIPLHLLRKENEGPIINKAIY